PGSVAIQIAGRLVREDTSRLSNQRTRDRRALTLPSRKFPRCMRQPVAEAYLFQYVCRVFISFAIAHAPDEQRHRYVFQGTEFRQQVMKLINESERPVTQPAPFFLVNRGNIKP